MAYLGFKALAAKAGGGQKGAAIAAAAGRKKYGAKGFAQLGAAGKANPRRSAAAKKAMAAKVGNDGDADDVMSSPKA